MKQISLLTLLLAFTFSAVTPQFALAKNDVDDNRYQSEERKDGEKKEKKHRDNKNNNQLEVEADVYTDLTIVKVELASTSSKKTVFTTVADTEAEVVSEVATRFNLTEAEVEAVLDFEIKDKASRTKERSKISNKNNRPVKVCLDDSNDELGVEAKVFTNTTIIKVKLQNGDKSVHETSATTSDDIAAFVVDRIDSLTLTEVKSVLDLKIKNRVSLPADLINETDSDCKDLSEKKDKQPSINEIDILNRIASLQKMIEALMRIMSARLGN